MIYEKEWGNPNYKFLSYDVDNLNWNMHYHESFEICFIINGEINIIIDTDCYNLKQNDSVIIFPRQLHSYETAQRHTRNFQPGYKKQIFPARSSTFPYTIHCWSGFTANASPFTHSFDGKFFTSSSESGRFEQ